MHKNILKKTAYILTFLVIVCGALIWGQHVANSQNIGTDLIRDTGEQNSNNNECIEELLFEDDFNDGDTSDWDVRIGDWYPANDYYVGSGLSYTIAPITVEGMYRIEGDFLFPTVSSRKEVDLLFNVEWVQELPKGEFCQVQNRIDVDAVAVGGWNQPLPQFYLDKEMTQPHPPSGVFNYDFEPNVWYHFQFDVTDESIAYYIEDELIFHLWMPEPLPGHEFGFKVYPSGESYVDNVVVTSLCPSQPTCDDGVMNGDEEGVDCGGSCPNECVFDSDNDGVIDENDLCPDTQLPEDVLLKKLLAQHYADTDSDAVFETQDKPSDSIIDSQYSLEDTHGCSCEQILEFKPGKNLGEQKFGCTQGTMQDFIEQKGWAENLIE